jgi:hypothetical protein
MERQNVDSSLATSVGYDIASSTLEIEFRSKGQIWQYFDVHESVYYEMMSSGSIGKYFLANIKGIYRPERVG